MRTHAEILEMYKKEVEGHLKFMSFRPSVNPYVVAANENRIATLAWVLGLRDVQYPPTPGQRTEMVRVLSRDQELIWIPIPPP